MNKQIVTSAHKEQLMITMRKSVYAKDLNLYLQEAIVKNVKFTGAKNVNHKILMNVKLANLVSSYQTKNANVLNLTKKSIGKEYAQIVQLKAVSFAQQVIL